MPRAWTARFGGDWPSARDRDVVVAVAHGDIELEDVNGGHLEAAMALLVGDKALLRLRVALRGEVSEPSRNGRRSLGRMRAERCGISPPAGSGC